MYLIFDPARRISFLGQTTCFSSCQLGCLCHVDLATLLIAYMHVMNAETTSIASLLTKTSNILTRTSVTLPVVQISYKQTTRKMDYN